MPHPFAFMWKGLVSQASSTCAVGHVIYTVVHVTKQQRRWDGVNFDMVGTSSNAKVVCIACGVDLTDKAGKQ